jgi:hypothetical protein
MSRLESHLRRIAAQRDCLNHARDLIAGLGGPALELGLGNGRTYDHLRQILPEREIFVFDRRVRAHPVCVPDEAHMILGDFLDTLPAARERIGRPAALAHCDVGSGDAGANRELARRLGPALAPLMAPGAVIVCDQELRVPGWTGLDLPAGVAPGRYFIWRA